MTEVLVDLAFLIGFLGLSACVIVFAESKLKRQ